MEMARTKTTTSADMQIHQGLKSIYQAGELTDFTIIVNDVHFKVSKIVLASQSMYFNRMLLGEWKEATATNVTLLDEDTTTISDMLEFMYSGTYNPTIPSPPSTQLTTTTSPISDDNTDTLKAAIATHITQYIAADKFIVPALQQAAQHWFTTTVDKLTDHAVLLDVLDEVYANVPGLRAAAAKCMMKHIELLLEDERFKRMMVEVEGLAVDVCGAVLRDGRVWRMQLSCANCGESEVLARGNAGVKFYCGCDGLPSGVV